MRKHNAEFRMLSHLKVVGFATMYNFQTWTRKTSNDLEQSLDAPARTLRNLLQKELIYKIPAYPDTGKLFRYDTFYAPVEIKKEKMARREMMHVSGITDILLAFIYLYPDYDISIKREHIFTNKNKTIRVKPDAWIHMVKKDETKKVFDFLLEFENSREPTDLYKDTIKKYERFANLAEIGLDPHAKILIVVSVEYFNAYWRPVEYEQDHISKNIQAIRNKLDTLLTLAYPYRKHFFIYSIFPDFYRLNEAVWFLPEGKRVKLIN